MRLSIRHETRYAYAEEAAGAVMRLRLMPRDTNGQRVERWQVSVNGAPVERWITNGLGEAEAIWRGEGRIGEAIVVAEGLVETLDKAGIFRSNAEDAHPQAFLCRTPLTAPDAAIEALAQEARKPDDMLASLHALCGLIHRRIDYRPGATSAATTAAEALAQGSGVCQDQAHIFISAARLLGLPARYVTGYLLDPLRDDDAHDPHGWAEALLPGIGWVGFDATLDICPTDHHVRLTCGMDAHDAAPIRGVAQLVGPITMEADVHITDLASAAGPQAQAQQ